MDDPVEHPVQPTVLIVDDQRGVTEMLHDLLETRGYRVLAANDPARALVLLRDDPRPIDLLLVDVIMPQLAGRDPAASVQERWPDCQVIYMSGYAREQLPPPGVPASSSILMKPIAISALFDAVHGALGSKGRSL
jgi:CheY-like chemotaxis protein